MYIAIGQGQTTPGAKILMSTETSCHFGHLLQVSKKPLRSLILYIFFFMILYMYISLGQVQTAPRLQSFDVNTNALPLHSFVPSFKKMSLKSDFIQFFSWFNNVHSPGAVADNPQETKFWCQQKGLITLPIWSKFQRNLFDVWFYAIFFII